MEQGGQGAGWRAAGRRRAHQRPDPVDRRVQPRLDSKAEVDEFEHPRSRDDAVLGLDVAVDDPAGVEVGEGQEQGADDLRNDGERGGGVTGMTRNEALSWRRSEDRLGPELAQSEGKRNT